MKSIGRPSVSMYKKCMGVPENCLDALTNALYYFGPISIETNES